jgi:hypothetical protein
VELHHGRIWMEPNPDLYGGSIFKFSLPGTEPAGVSAMR